MSADWEIGNSQLNICGTTLAGPSSLLKDHSLQCDWEIEHPSCYVAAAAALFLNSFFLSSFLLSSFLLSSFVQHHCRLCGQIFCEICTNWKINVPELDISQERACRNCHKFIYEYLPLLTNGILLLLLFPSSIFYLLSPSSFFLSFLLLFLVFSFFILLHLFVSFY